MGLQSDNQGWIDSLERSWLDGDNNGIKSLKIPARSLLASRMTDLDALLKRSKDEIDPENRLNEQSFKITKNLLNKYLADMKSACEHWVIECMNNDRKMDELPIALDAFHVIDKTDKKALQLAANRFYVMNLTNSKNKESVLNTLSIYYKNDGISLPTDEEVLSSQTSSPSDPNILNISPSTLSDTPQAGCASLDLKSLVGLFKDGRTTKEAFERELDALFLSALQANNKDENVARKALIDALVSHKDLFPYAWKCGLCISYNNVFNQDGVNPDVFQSFCQQVGEAPMRELVSTQGGTAHVTIEPILKKYRESTPRVTLTSVRNDRSTHPAPISDLLKDGSGHHLEQLVLLLGGIDAQTVLNITLDIQQNNQIVSVSLLQYASKKGVYSLENLDGVNRAVLNKLLEHLGSRATQEINNGDLINTSNNSDVKEIFETHRTKYPVVPPKSPSLALQPTQSGWSAANYVPLPETEPFLSNEALIGGWYGFSRVGVGVCMLSFFCVVVMTVSLTLDDKGCHDFAHNTMRALGELLCWGGHEADEALDIKDTRHAWGLERAPSYTGGHKAGVLAFSAGVLTLTSAVVAGVLGLVGGSMSESKNKKSVSPHG